jgi:copper/silver efflux system protein
MRLLFTHARNFNFRPRWLARVDQCGTGGAYPFRREHPISRILIRIYAPACAWALRWRWAVIARRACAGADHDPVYNQLGSEFMPPLDEGTLLFMPSTLPGISLTEAQRLMQIQNRIIRTFPGSADHPRQGRTRGDIHRSGATVHDGDGGGAEAARRVAQGGHVVHQLGARMERCRCSGGSRRPISTDQLVEEMNEKLKLPGVSNAWTMPVKGRIDMLTTGIRTPVGVKVFGADIHTIERLGTEIERVLPAVQGTRSVFAERTGGGYFVDFDWNRDALARYGLTIDDAQAVVMNAVGGETVTTTVEDANATR